MQKRMVWFGGVFALLAASGVASAHHSLARYDTDTPIRIEGVIVRFERVNPHSFVYLDEKTGNGRVGRWAVEGPSPRLLARRGIDTDQLIPGRRVEACGYLMKGDRGWRGRVSAEPLSLRQRSEERGGTSGRVLVAEWLVLPDGQGIPWSDYGHGHCGAPEQR